MGTTPSIELRFDDLESFLAGALKDVQAARLAATRGLYTPALRLLEGTKFTVEAIEDKLQSLQRRLARYREGVAPRPEE